MKCEQPSGKLSSHWKGCGDISGNCWTKIKSDAQKRNIEFDITIEYAWEVFVEQNHRCALSGIELEFAPTLRRKNERTSSLDRIDNNKGYVKGNVQWVHKEVNFMKQKLSQEDFIEWCRKITKYQSKRMK